MSAIAPGLVLLAYLCGSISSAILVCRLAGLPDPRDSGSGNPGATNVLRIGGKGAAVAVLIFDVLKGMLPVWGAWALGLTPFWLGLVAIAACVGHIWPVFFHFRGGKGVATAFGAIAPIGLDLTGVMAGTWLLTILLSGYSSLGAIVSALIAPFYVWWFKPQYTFPVSMLAVVVMFWRRLFGLIGIHFGKPPAHEGQGSGRLSLIHILLGMIPAVVMGLIFHDTIKSLFNPVNVMYALIVGGVLLIAAEVLKPKQPRAVGIDDMTYRQAFVIGCFQCLALWPGFSRSGATISGGMLMGVSRYAASEFSFLLAVPMMMGATVLDVYKSIGFLNMGDVPMFAVGFVMAFIVALIAIKTFLQLIKRISFIPFAIYRFIVAAAVYVVFF